MSDEGDAAGTIKNPPGEPIISQSPKRKVGNTSMSACRDQFRSSGPRGTPLSPRTTNSPPAP